jgi:hypothetical protein
MGSRRALARWFAAALPIGEYNAFGLPERYDCKSAVARRQSSFPDALCAILSV